MKKVAIFDFDGTLSKGYISMGFLEYLNEKGAFSKEEYKNQINMLKEVKESKLSYEKWCFKWGISWARGLEGQKKEKIEEYAKKFFNKFKKKYIPHLTRLLTF